MDNNRFYNSSRSVLTGALKTTRQLNKRQKDILGFIYSQAEFMHAPVYREHGSIAISSASLAQACRPAVSCMTALSIAYELEKAGFLKIERANKGEKGVANRYTLTDLFFEWMKATNDELKKDVDMDQDSELNRQIQSLQERVDGLTHQLGEKDKLIAELQDEKARLQARVDNAIKWYNANNGKVKALEAENAELLNKFKEANRGWNNERDKTGRLKEEIYKQKAEIDRLKRYEDVFKRLVRDGVIDQKGNPVGGGMVTVEPEVPYGIMKPDELLHEFSTVIKNKN